MFFARISQADINYISSMLGVEYVKKQWIDQEIVGDSLYQNAEVFLEKAETRAKWLLENNETFNQNIDYSRLQHALASFYFIRLEDTRYGLDYEAELRSFERIFSNDAHPHLLRYVVTIPGDKGFGLDRENHNFGYHIHYVRVNGRGSERTNAIFMFDPKEAATITPLLYWEPHHEAVQVHVNPGSFGNRRKMAIYDTCTPFLNKVPKAMFKRPSNNASHFHP